MTKASFFPTWVILVPLVERIFLSISCKHEYCMFRINQKILLHLHHCDDFLELRRVFAEDPRKKKKKRSVHNFPNYFKNCYASQKLLKNGTNKAPEPGKRS